jgi:hypothetical protein
MMPAVLPEDVRASALEGGGVRPLQLDDLVGQLPGREHLRRFTGPADILETQVEQKGGTHLLRPLLARLECPSCHTRATFYLDLFDAKSRKCRNKSMEHAHTIDEVDGQAFRRIGMISA